MILDFQHVTKDGKRMLVSQMDTDHLLNLINLRLKKANEVFVASKQSVDPYKARLYGIRGVDPEQAAALVEDMLARTAPYFIEAFFRYDELSKHEEVMTHIRELMQSVLQRAGKLEQFDVPALPSSLYDEDIEEEFPDPEEGDR